MKLNDFKNKKITVMGIGLNEGGRGTIIFLSKLGAKILATDLKTEKELAPSLKKLQPFKIKYVLGKHRRKDFLNVDLIIKNPAVSSNHPYLQIALKHHIPIESEIGIFYQLLNHQQPLIAVTGAKGKSTTAALIAFILKKYFKSVILGGNIGISILNQYFKIKPSSFIVLEVSAQQLEDLKRHKFRPQVAILTNILEDHLDRYHSFKKYIQTKKIIFQFQTFKDYLILNYDDQILKNISKSAKSKVYWFSFKQLPKSKKGIFVKNNNLMFNDGKKYKNFMNLKEFKINHQFQLEAIMAAVLVAFIYQIPVSIIKKAIKEFKWLPYRLSYLKTFRGIKIYNDSTATIPAATLKAIKTFHQPLALIMGGQDKKLNFNPLVEELETNPLIKKVIILNHPRYDASLKIKGLFKQKNGLNKIIEANSLKEALKKGINFLKKDEILLFSPAAASFGMFQNEFDRGREFTKVVKMLKYVYKG